jgi:hypothetical protein
MITLLLGRTQRGGGKAIRPSACMRSIATRADIAFSPPSGLNHPSAWHIKRDSSARSLYSITFWHLADQMTDNL